MHASAPTSTNVLATVLAQTLTKKLASASASKLKTHPALSLTQFSMKIFVLAQTLAVLTLRHVTSQLYPTLIRVPANASATDSSLLTQSKKLPINIAKQSNIISFSTVKTADANAV